MVEGSREAPGVRRYTVFSQQGPAADVDAWDAYGARFLAVRVGLAERPVRGADGLSLRLVVAPAGGSGEVVSLEGRDRSEEDLRRAERADGGRGLAALAGRCPSVWLIGAPGEDAAAALRLAAVVAGVSLGPILERATGSLFGVKTAREKLAFAGLRPL